MFVICVECNEISQPRYEVPPSNVIKKKISTPSENYVKKSKNVYMHKVDQCTKRNQERENIVEIEDIK